MGTLIAPIVSGVAGSVGGGLIKNLLGGSQDATPQGVKNDQSYYGAAQRQGVEAQSGMIAGAQPQRTQFLNQLGQQALGGGPNLSELQLRSAMDRSLANQVAAAKAARGVNPALAARQASLQGAATQQNIAGQAAQARIQEQRQQQQMFANQLASEQGALQGMYNGATGNANAAQAAGRAQGNLGVGAGLNVGSAIMGSKFGEGLGQAASGLFSGGAQQPVEPQGDIAPSRGSLGMSYSKGGYVEGGEVVRGNSPENDNVDAKLSAGEIVLPKSVVKAHVSGDKQAVKSFVEKALEQAQNELYCGGMAKKGYSAGGMAEGGMAKKGYSGGGMAEGGVADPELLKEHYGSFHKALQKHMGGY